MRVEVRKSFLWAPDGNHVRTVAVGEVLEGEGARHALAMGDGLALEEESKALEGAPLNAAAPRAPRNKGR
jgi:hypothetical protein